MIDNRLDNHLLGCSVETAKRTLACNAGLGNSDLANLPLAAINFDTGWCDFPRPKTGISRRIPEFRADPTLTI